MFATVLICLLACCLLMTIAWLWAGSIRNAGVVDVFWAFNFPLIGLLILLLGPGWFSRKIMIAWMIIIAGGRLSLHLGMRVIGHLNEEEGRYKQLRAEWQPHPDRKFFGSSRHRPCQTSCWRFLFF